MKIKYIFRARNVIKTYFYAQTKSKYADSSVHVIATKTFQFHIILARSEKYSQ